MRVISVLIIVILGAFSCEKQIYYYLDKNTLFVFNKTDTLVFKGITTCDTFVVKTAETRWRNTDKKNNYQQFVINMPELTNDCRAVSYDYCGGIFINRDADGLTYISFRNYFTSALENKASITSITTGKHTLSQVYKLDCPISGTPNDKAVQAIYYTYNYGLVAYELISGERIELEEKYLKP